MVSATTMMRRMPLLGLFSLVVVNLGGGDASVGATVNVDGIETTSSMQDQEQPPQLQPRLSLIQQQEEPQPLKQQPQRSKLRLRPLSMIVVKSSQTSAKRATAATTTSIRQQRQRQQPPQQNQQRQRRIRTSSETLYKKEMKKASPTRMAKLAKESMGMMMGSSSPTLMTMKMAVSTDDDDEEGGGMGMMMMSMMKLPAVARPPVSTATPTLIDLITAPLPPPTAPPTLQANLAPGLPACSCWARDDLQALTTQAVTHSCTTNGSFIILRAPGGTPGYAASLIANQCKVRLSGDDNNDNELTDANADGDAAAADLKTITVGALEIQQCYALVIERCKELGTPIRLPLP